MKKAHYWLISGVVLLVICGISGAWAYSSWTKESAAYQYTSLAIKAIGDGDYDEAIEYLTKALEANPDYAPAYYNLGIAYGNEDQFHRYYKLPGQTFTEAGYPEMQDKYEKAVYYYTLLETKFPEYKPIAEMGLGDVNFLYYCGYVNREKHVLPHYLYALEHIDVVEKHLGKEGVSALYTNLARTYLAMAKVEEARSYYLKAISVYPDPGIDTAYEHLAWVELELGNITGAYQVAQDFIQRAEKYGWDKDLGLMPASISAYLLGKYDEAMEYAKEITEKHPDSAYVGEAYRTMALIYHLKGDDANAVKMLEKDISNCLNAIKNPEDATTIPTAKYEMALAYYLLAKLTDNQTALTKSIENLEWIINNPDQTKREVAHRNYYILAHLSLASIYTEKQLYSQALSTLQSLKNTLQADPDMKGWKDLIGNLVDNLIQKASKSQAIEMPELTWILSH